jgi:divalent metal cation (Fe/Co/Zn/Cd) transporter
MATVTRPAESLIRQARIAEALTLAWMAIELVVALWAGTAARSVALTTFGVDSGIELFTAAVVLRQLLLHTDRATDEELDARERQASRIVGWGLYGLIVYIVATSAWSLVSRSHPESSTAGLALAVAALVVMPLLWRWRLSLARRLDSPALRADAACSLVCIYMSAVLLAGLALNILFGWWWADSLAALAMIWWIRGEAREALEAARTGVHEDDD